MLKLYVIIQEACHVKQEFQKICRFFKQQNCFLKFSQGSEKCKRITKVSKTKKKKKKNSTKIIKLNTLIWFALNEGIKFKLPVSFLEHIYIDKLNLALKVLKT